MINKIDIEMIEKTTDIKAIDRKNIKVIDKKETETTIDKIEISLIDKKKKSKVTEAEIDQYMISNPNNKLNKENHKKNTSKKNIPSNRTEQKNNKINQGKTNINPTTTVKMHKSIAIIIVTIHKEIMKGTRTTISKCQTLQSIPIATR